MIPRHDLLSLKTRALRLNVWFKTLSRTERAIIDLTVRCVERVKSRILEATIANIMDKILKALECLFSIKAERLGREIARQLGQIAEKWGNKTASKWKLDKSFIIFLGVSTMNN